MYGNRRQHAIKKEKEAKQGTNKVVGRRLQSIGEISYPFVSWPGETSFSGAHENLASNYYDRRSNENKDLELTVRSSIDT